MKSSFLFIFILAFAMQAQSFNPNDNPNWDWRQTSDSLYLSSNVMGQCRLVASPFNQAGRSTALDDNDPLDGWTLVVRNFGKPTEHISLPYFVLYNKYQ